MFVNSVCLAMYSVHVALTEIGHVTAEVERGKSVVIWTPACEVVLIVLVYNRLMFVRDRKCCFIVVVHLHLIIMLALYLYASSFYRCTNH